MSPDRPKAPFRLIYNNDTTNTFACVSPWHAWGEPFREEHLVASIDETAGRGVDAHVLCPGSCWVPWWQSEVVPDHVGWWMGRTGLRPEMHHGFERYVFEGGDMVRVLIDRCRAGGMAPLVSYRVNDVHLLEQVDEPTPASIRVCRFYAENPQWWLDRDHKRRKGYYGLRGMDMAAPEVRRYKLALIRELCEGYDLAGLELDFLRDNRLFRPEQPRDERVEIITDFVREVRGFLDARRVPGYPRRWLCVRIPSALRAHEETGLDVERLYAAGVDVFTLSTWYHTSFRTDLPAVRRRLPRAALYAELTHSTGGHPYFVSHEAYGTQGNPRCSDAELTTAAHVAHARGADGVYLFNFVYYRRLGPELDIPVTEPPFHLLPQLADPDALARQRQHYTVAQSPYWKQVPRDLTPGEPTALVFDLALTSTETVEAAARRAERMRALDGTNPERPGYPDPASVHHARLRLHFLQSAAGRTIRVRLNGQPVEPSDDVSRIYGNPFDGMISPRENRRAFSLPRTLLHDGENTVEVRIESGEPVKLIYADLALE